MSPVCPSWLSFILYNPIRKAFTDREKILDECGVTKDSVVLEVGAGNGFLTEAIAELAKKVYTVELQKRVLRFADKVSIIHGDIASVILKEEVFDICLMYYSFHEVSNKIDAVDNISRALKTGGILPIYEPTI